MNIYIYKEKGKVGGEGEGGRGVWRVCVPYCVPYCVAHSAGSSSLAAVVDGSALAFGINLAAGGALLLATRFGSCRFFCRRAAFFF